MPKNTDIIAFPHMGDYYVPAHYLLSHLFTVPILDAPKITAHTVELGTKHSPDFVCTPFKYTLGTMIESLDAGATILIQAGGGCKYGYYSELQEQILKDLGYEFTFLNLVSAGKTDYKKIYKTMKKIDPKFSLLKALYYTFVASKMIRYMDQIDHIIRANIGFEKEKGTFLKLHQRMLRSFSNVNGYLDLYKQYHFYKEAMKEVETVKPDKLMKVGVIGELYTLMEPYANYNLEMKLAQFGIEVKRYTNVHYLVFEKKHKVKQYLKQAKKYIRYKMGADAADNIARTKELCEKGYDGIIHIKSSFCTPEIGAMPIIQKICNEYQVPVVFFSFDSNTSEVGVETRLEAFYDMLEMRRKK